MSGAFVRRTVTGLALALLCARPHTILAQTHPAHVPGVPAEATEPQGFLSEPDLVQRAVILADRQFGNGELTNGLYADLWNMIPGSGWISAGPGYRRWYAGDQVFLDTSAAISWRAYKTAHARIELPKIARSRLALGSEVRWQDFTQVNFFGEGSDALKSNRSEYRLRSNNLVGYATFRPVEWLGIGGNIGWLDPSVLPRAGTFQADRPDTRDLLPGDIVFRLADQPTFLHSELSITADTRDFPGHPLRGGLVRAAAANYSDRDAGVFTFKRYEAEGAGFVPLVGSRMVIASHGWLVTSDADAGHFVPFYLQPSLGGQNTLRAFMDYRFHDRDMLVVNVEARFAMMTHVDAAVLFDAGNVAARVADLNLDKRSYGAGLRVHSRRQTFGRLDVARGSDGWRMLFWLSDPLNLARLTRRTAQIPFVP